MEPAEKKPAGTTKTAEDKPNDAAPVEADRPADAIKSAEDSIAEVVKPAVGIPTDVAKPAAGVPTNVAKPVVEGTPNGIAEVVKLADEKPDSDPNGIADVAKFANKKLDSDPKLGKDTIGLPEQVLGSTLGNTIHVPIAHLVNVWLAICPDRVCHDKTTEVPASVSDMASPVTMGVVHKETGNHTYPPLFLDVCMYRC